MGKLLKKKEVKNFILTNKMQIIVSFVLALVGVIVGVIIDIKSSSTISIGSSTKTTLIDLINGDYNTWGLFFYCFGKLFLSIMILFVFSLTAITSLLNYVYISYQGMLLGITVSGVMSEFGLAGTLNICLFIAPVNLINIAIIVFASSLFIKRREYQKKFKKNLSATINDFSSSFIFLFIITILSSFIYGIIYPLLLRSFIIVNY